MLRTKHITYLIFLLMAMLSCIKPFDPTIDPGAAHKFVVSGCITDVEGLQTVTVAVSSPVSAPQNTPLSGCAVTIFSDTGKEFATEESEPGNYTVWMNKDDLVPGTSYQVVVNTPTGEVLTSDFDKMPGCPPVDTLYYLLEDHLTSDPSVNDRGIQFYVDLEASESDSRYYRWEVVETWEYHAAHKKENYYDGDFHTIDPPDSSTWICYSNRTLPDVFTLSTQNLTENAYKKYALQFVNGKSSQLSVLYSMLLRQYALSETSFNYWEQLRLNNYEEIGLYETQPMDIKGNIRMTSGAGQEVLGLFYAASVSTKRVFVQNVEGLEIDFQIDCTEDQLGHFGWAEYHPKDYPVYYYFPEGGGLLILVNECVECEMAGGTLEKPDFWPE